MRYLENGPIPFAGYKAPAKCVEYWPQSMGRNKGKCVKCGESESAHVVFEGGVDLAAQPDVASTTLRFGDKTACYFCLATNTQKIRVNHHKAGMVEVCVLGCKGKA